MELSKFQKVTLQGSGRARGRAHGEALRPLIEDHYDRWLTAISEDLCIDPRTYVADFLAGTDFLPAVERWTPDLLEEVKGIAEGANLAFDVVFARQLSDEEPWYRREFKLGRPSHAGCTSIGVRYEAEPEAPVIVAQNMDMPDYCEGVQVLLHIKDDVTGLEVLEFSLAGKINLAGMNSAGLAMACNGLSQLDYSKTGLPEDFVVRGFLNCHDLKSGLAFLRNIEHASGQNYTVAEPGVTPLNLEISAHSMTTFEPAGPKGCVYHTNHPLTNSDTSMFRRQSKGLSSLQLEKLYYGTSHARLADLKSRFGELAGPPGVAEIKEFSSSHVGPVCRHGDDMVNRRDNFTIGCLIMELGQDLRMHIAPGPPCETPFETFEFDGR